jgi:diphthamide synthase subunit DPH2
LSVISGDPGRRCFAWNSLSKLGGKPDFWPFRSRPECPTAFLAEEAAIDMRDADQCYRRAVGQAERRIAVIFLGRRDNMLDRIRILAGKGYPVGVVEAEHRVMSASPAVLNKFGPEAGIDLGIAAAAG